MRKRMNKTRSLRLRGATLIGLVALVVGLAAVLVLSPDIVLGQASSSKGKPPAKPVPKPALYQVYFSTTPPDMGIDTVNYPSCNVYGYVLAEWDAAHNFLHADGTMIDQECIPLLMQLSTDVSWKREYVADPVKGLSGDFDGCYGETDYYNGALFITFNKKRKETYIRFTWYFDYYTAPDVREHFALFSDDIPFPAWTGDDIVSEPVTGRFDLQYYLNDPDNLPSYVSLTNDEGCTFNIYLKIEKVIQ